MLVAEINPTMLFMLGALLIVSVMLRRAMRALSRDASASDCALPREPTTAGPRVSGATDELARWEIRMHELSRDLSGQLDTKIIVVEQLLRRVEQQTARLELAISEAQRWGVGQTEAASAGRDDPLVDNWPLAGDPARLAADALTPSTTQRAVADQLRRQVAALAAQGKPASAIAKQLDAPLGEVELLLSLRSDAIKRD